MAELEIDRLPGRQGVWVALCGNARVWGGGGVVALFALIALFAPVLAPQDPLWQDLMLYQMPPAWLPGSEPGYWLGTDSLGRDLLSRLIHGTQVALIVAVVAAGAAGALGVLLGLMAGYFGGWVDALISRLIDVWMAFPPVLLSIVLVAVLGAGLHSVIIAIAVIDWTRFARVVRAEVLVQKEQDYVASAVTIGLGRWRILFGEVLPNVAPLILVLFTMEMAIAVIVETILSFVGLSVASDRPTWGGMIAEGRQVIYEAPWMMLMPIGCLIALVLALNALGDGLKTALDPVLRR